MNAKDLRVLLAAVPDDEAVSVSLGSTASPEYVEVHSRDIVEMDGHSTRVKSVTPATEITSSTHHGPLLGWERLTPEVEKKIRYDILWRLSRKGFEGRQVFMLNGNDFRIYTDTGSSQDHCYGRSYDPRAWNALEASGLIVKSEMPSGGWNSIDYSITDAGRAALNVLQTKAA